VEKVVRVFRSKAEAEEADREYYRSLTPKERVDVVIELVKRSGPDAERFDRVCRVVPRERKDGPLPQEETNR
jgi:hypothetical protein